MTRDEVFNEIIKLPEWKLYNKAYRVYKTRHKQGVLGSEAYEKIFRHFGYIKTAEVWERQKEK